MTYDEFRNEVDMLTGCINRMCVTSDLDELESMHSWACLYLLNVYDYRFGCLKSHSDVSADPSL